MKRRSILQMLMAVFAATASLSVHASPLNATPFVLRPDSISHRYIEPEWLDTPIILALRTTAEASGPQ